MTNALTTNEITELAKQETIIKRGLKTFIDVGNALAVIRDERLYRRDASTFEEYCRERWGMSKRHSNRMIAASYTIQNLGPIGPVPQTESQARPLTKLQPEEQIEAWQEAVDTAPHGKITAAHVEHTIKRMQPDGTRGYVYHNGDLQNTISTCQVCNNLYDGTSIEFCPYCAYTQEQRIEYLRNPNKKTAAHVSNNSGNNEWYTPPEYIEAARIVLGNIDLDPASSEIANQTVKATVYYTEEENGLELEWHGRIWMNPPYAQPAITNFCKKLADELDAGNVTEALTLTNNATETEWFRTLSERCNAVCFPSGRIKFLDMDGNRSGAPLQGQAILYFGRRLMEFYETFYKFGMVFYA